MTPEEVAILRGMAAEELKWAGARDEAAEVWRGLEEEGDARRNASIAAKCRSRAAAIESALREIEKLRTIGRDRGALLDEYGDRERRGR